jgi:hypothetical protein
MSVMSASFVGALPVTASLARYVRAHAVFTERDFLAALPGPAVLVRLDERGGDDEAAPWAVPRYDDVDLPAPDVGADDMYFDLASASGTTEQTATGPAQPPLPLPRAREHATAHVVPAAGGVIGRDATVAVRVKERSISRRHALLEAHGSQWLVTDLDSDNGTGVNGLPLLPGTSSPLRSGDVLQHGDVVFLFLDGASFYLHLSALAGV